MAIKYPFEKLPSGRHRRYLQLRDVVKLAEVSPDSDPEEWKEIGRCESWDNRPEESWDLSCGYDNALKMLKIGWPEKVKELTNRARVISAVSARPNIEYSHEIAGDEVDVSRFLAGEPECFLEGKLTDKDSENPVISIGYSISQLAWVSAETRTRAGAAAFAIVQALESLGRAVEITLCISTRGGGGWYGDTEENCVVTEYIKIKEAHEYLNPSRLAFMMIHPAMFRRIGFRLKEQYPTELQTGLGVRNAGYGETAYVYQEDLPKDSIVFNSIREHEDVEPFKSDESAGLYIKKILETKGISFS